MKIIKILFLAIITCVMAGCTKDSLSPQDSSQQTLLLKVETPTAAAESDEDIISDARVIVFRDANTLDANSGKKTITSGETITQTVTAGTRDIYVFANESQVQGMTAKLDGVRTLSALQAIQVPYSADIAPPFLSSVKETKTLTDNTSMTANVERIVSKVVLTIKYEWLGLTIDRVQVKNLPPFSYLIAQPYTQTAYVNSKVIEGTDLDDINPDDGFTYQSKPLTIYIPEFLGATSAAGRHAYLEIVGHYGVVTSTYRMPLSSNMAADGTITGTNYDIARNTAFIIDATIKDFGELNNIVIAVELQHWEMVNSTPEDVGHYVVFTKAEHGDGTLLTDNGHITAAGETIKIYCTSGTGGWIASLRNGKGVEISSRTAPLSSDPEQVVELLVPALDPSLNRDELTIEVYHPSIAMKAHKLRFVQSGQQPTPNRVQSGEI